jgi:hypothetical protein
VSRPRCSYNQWRGQWCRSRVTAPLLVASTTTPVTSTVRPVGGMWSRSVASSARAQSSSVRTPVWVPVWCISTMAVASSVSRVTGRMVRSGSAVKSRASVGSQSSSPTSWARPRTGAGVGGMEPLVGGQVVAVVGVDRRREIRAGVHVVDRVECGQGRSRGGGAKLWGVGRRAFPCATPWSRSRRRRSVASSPVHVGGGSSLERPCLEGRAGRLGIASGKPPGLVGERRR